MQLKISIVTDPEREREIPIERGKWKRGK